MSETEAGKKRFQDLITGLTSSDREEKLLSIDALGILKIPEHAELLTDLLSSPDKEVVEHTIIALGRIANPASVKHLIEFVIGENTHLAETAFKVLKKINLNDELSVVIKACNSDQPVEIRLKILKLLSDYDDIRVTALVNEILGQTKASDLLVEAIKYLIKHPSTERHTVLKMLFSSSDWKVSLAATLALSRLKDEGSVTQVKRLAKSGNADIRQFIVKSLNQHPQIEDREIYQIFFSDSRAAIRELALNGLDLFAADERITILKNLINAETDKKLRKFLIKRAVKEGSSLFYDEFYRLLQSSDDDLKLEAIEAIASMGEKIVDRIIIDFDRMALIVKEQMILILGRIGGEKVIKIVSECLDAKERWLKINAVESCARICSPELIKGGETDVWVRATAISVLGRSKNHDYAEFVVSQLNHEDARVRANAIEALAELAWVDLPDVCHKLIHDPNDRVRVNAAISLWKSGHEEVFNELETMSRDKSRWVRSSAVFALGEIKDKKGTNILLNMISDSEEIVYKNALKALSEIGDMRALIPLLKEARKKRMPDWFFEEILERFSKNLRK
jgi:HEAT repeat protein